MRNVTIHKLCAYTSCDGRIDVSGFRDTRGTKKLALQV